MSEFVVCLSNEGFEAALEIRKIYRQLPDAWAEGEGLIRVVDESGEDYLYPDVIFDQVALSGRAAEVFAEAS